MLSLRSDHAAACCAAGSIFRRPQHGIQKQHFRRSVADDAFDADISLCLILFVRLQQRNLLRHAEHFPGVSSPPAGAAAAAVVVVFWAVAIVSAMSFGFLRLQHLKHGILFQHDSLLLLLLLWEGSVFVAVESSLFFRRHR